MSAANRGGVGMKLLDEIIEKAKKATPGRWEWNNAGGVWIYSEPGVGKTFIAGTVCSHDREAKEFHKNAEYIAAASPDRILKICEALKIVQEDLTSITRIDHGKIKNLAQACLDDIEKLLEGK